MAKRMKCPREGTKVVFQPNPASRMMYSSEYGLPNPGATGTVTTVPLPGGRKTCMPGPGGGLVYVKWDGGSTRGVSSFDLFLVRSGLGALGGPALGRGKERCPRGCVPASGGFGAKARGGLGAASDTYVSTYCNRPHRKSDGKPVQHECRIIPPEALKAEMEGDYERAIQIMESTPRRTMRRGVAGLDDFEARDLLYQWHGGGGSGVYQVASMMDHGVPEDAYERARGELAYVRAHPRHALKGDEREELDALIAWLDSKIGGGMAGLGHDDEPDEPDIITEDHTHWYQSGKLYFTGDEAGLRRKMEQDKFWPDVWFISDHGNAHLIAL